MKPREETRLLGLTGTNGSGKGEVASYFVSKGYAYISLSDLLREELRKRGQIITRDNLIKMGNTLRRRYGADILARRAIKKIKGRAVIDSIRNPEEVAFLRRQKGFRLIAVDGPVELRFKRAKKRGREESASTLKEFIAKEEEEMAGGRTKQRLRRCLALADVILYNDGSIAALHRKIEKEL